MHELLERPAALGQRLPGSHFHAEAAGQNFGSRFYAHGGLYPVPGSVLSSQRES